MRMTRVLPVGAALLTALALGAPASAQVGQPGSTPAPIALVGASNGSLAITSTGPSLDATITLRAKEAPTDVLVQVTAFRSQEGQTSDAKVEPERPRFQGRLTTVRVTAPLAFGGPFRAELTVTHDGIADDPIVLTVTRTRADTPLTVDSVQSAASVSWGGFRQRVRRSVTISETSGRRLQLDPVHVVKPSSRYGEQVSAANVVVTDVKVADGDRCSVDEAGRTTLEPGASCRLDLGLEMPAGAGSYEGALRFGAAGFKPVDEPMAVQLRRG
jgi:hypothetical protein